MPLPPKPIQRQLIDLVTANMTKRDIGQGEIARRTGLPASMVSRILAGKQVASLKTWQRIFDAVEGTTTTEETPGKESP